MSKVIIVTGSSRGIGAATAILAASKGYSVCVNYIQDANSANNVVSQIKQGGGNAIAVAADVSKDQEVERLFKIVDDELGTLHSLVNNIGILEHKARVDQIDMRRLNKIFTTNITSYFLCAREAVKRMSTQYGGKGGSIVNVSSAASRLGAAGEYVDYAASKGAIDTLTIGLAREVANESIRVNCVRPGFIYTDIHINSGDPNRVARISPSLPMRRGGQPSEIANSIMWLISDESSYITGTFIDAAGGL